MKLELGYWVTDLEICSNLFSSRFGCQEFRWQGKYYYFRLLFCKILQNGNSRSVKTWAHFRACFFLFTVRVLSSERQAQCEQNRCSSAAPSAKWVMEPLLRRRVELDPGVGGWGSKVRVSQSRKHLGAKYRNCLLRSSDRSLWTGRSSVWFISNRYLLWKHRGRL